MSVESGVYRGRMQQKYLLVEYGLLTSVHYSFVVTTKNCSMKHITTAANALRYYYTTPINMDTYRHL